MSGVPAVPVRPDSLRARLVYEPRELKFGTSGRRGRVVDLTQLEIYINVVAELEYLRSLPASAGGIVPGDEFYFARDLRASSSEYVPEQGGRGEIAQAVVRAVQDAGMRPVNLGRIPTPALALYAFAQRRGSIMVTGSHIPFDRNGYKTNTSRGELLKKDEQPIEELVRQVRQRLYAQPYAQSPFDESGSFKSGRQDLPPEDGAAREAYIRRYVCFFEGDSLAGQRIVVYQHSAVGRDILVEVLQRLGAEVIAAGRSETFVPIDTENIDAAQRAAIQALADQVRLAHGEITAVVSTDGDSDRPLVLGVGPDGVVCPFGGDLLGMIGAEYLRADAVVVPVSCSDAIERGPLREFLQPRTRIGSPYVIAGMQNAGRRNKRAVCGWEANGGFLTGSPIARRGRVLEPLPTRDALLPILCALFAARDAGCSVAELFARLPARYSRSGLLRQFPREAALGMLAHFAPRDPAVEEVLFGDRSTVLLDGERNAVAASEAAAKAMEATRRDLEAIFSPDRGFGRIIRINYTDGMRIFFSNGDVAHVRASGNADELRIYAVADDPSRAEQIVEMGIAEPGGLLRALERAPEQNRVR